MKKLVVLTVLALALGTVHQAVACEYGAHAANATPIVVATTQEQTAQPSAATPAPAEPKADESLAKAAN
jgi:hypothetical protein